MDLGNRQSTAFIAALSLALGMGYMRPARQRASLLDLDDFDFGVDRAAGALACSAARRHAVARAIVATVACASAGCTRCWLAVVGCVRCAAQYMMRAMALGTHARTRTRIRSSHTGLNAAASDMSKAVILIGGSSKGTWRAPIGGAAFVERRCRLCCARACRSACAPNASSCLDAWLTRRVASHCAAPQARASARCRSTRPSRCSRWPACRC